MNSSLETRLPFLDHDLVEWAFRLPISAKVKGSKGKWILRQILSRYLPPSLFERPKQGFGVPIDLWLNSSLKNWANDLLDYRFLKQQGIFNARVVNLMWTQHQSGSRRFHHQLWSILMFQTWFAQHRPIV